MNKSFIFLLILFSFFTSLKCQNVPPAQRFGPVDPSKRLRGNGMKYSNIFCYQRTDENDAGKVFKIFIDRNYHNRPCQILIPSRVFVYFFANFHFPSIAAIISGNVEDVTLYSHVPGIVMPRLHEPTIHGPIYAPCDHSRVLYRSLDLHDSLLFAFVMPSAEYIAQHPDPESCEYTKQNSQLRKSIGYIEAPWLRMTDEPFEVMLGTLKEVWADHTSSLPEYNSSVAAVY